MNKYNNNNKNDEISILLITKQHTLQIYHNKKNNP